MDMIKILDYRIDPREVVAYNYSSQDLRIWFRQPDRCFVITFVNKEQFESFERDFEDFEREFKEAVK